MAESNTWRRVFFVGAALGAIGQMMFMEVGNAAPSVAGAENEADILDAHVIAIDTHHEPEAARLEAGDQTTDPDLESLRQQLAIERAGQEKAVADAVARWPREDQDRAVRAWHSWYSVRPVLAHNGYGEWMFDALEVLFSPGESAELTAFYMKLQSYEAMRKLREYPQIHYWSEEGGREALPPEWQALYKSWDAKVKDRNDLVPIAAAGVASIVGGDGLARLLAGVTPPFSPETTPDYDNEFRRWFGANRLNKWRRFLFEMPY